MISLDGGSPSDSLHTFQIRNLTKHNLPSLQRLGLLRFQLRGGSPMSLTLNWTLNDLNWCWESFRPPQDPSNPCRGYVSLGFSIEGVNQCPQYSVGLSMTSLDAGSPSDLLKTQNLTKPNLPSLYRLGYFRFWLRGVWPMSLTLEWTLNDFTWCWKSFSPPPESSNPKPNQT